MRNPYARVSAVMEFSTPPGSEIRIIREGYWDGCSLKLREIGRENIHDRIQAYAPFCDLHYMLHRLSVGDNSVCCKTAPVYGDFSGMPDNPVDTINMLNNARDRFDSLSLEQRKQYNMDYMAWLADKMKPKNPDVSGETTKEGETTTE